MFMGTLTLPDGNANSLHVLIRTLVKAHPTAVHEIRIEANASNSGPVYIGPKSVSNTNYGAVLAAASKEFVQIGGDSADLALEIISVVGTTNDKIHVICR